MRPFEPLKSLYLRLDLTLNGRFWSYLAYLYTFKRIPYSLEYTLKLACSTRAVRAFVPFLLRACLRRAPAVRTQQILARTVQPVRYRVHARMVSSGVHERAIPAALQALVRSANWLTALMRHAKRVRY